MGGTLFVYSLSCVGEGCCNFSPYSLITLYLEDPFFITKQWMLKLYQQMMALIVICELMIAVVLLIVNQLVACFEN